MKELCLNDDCPVKKQKKIRNVKTNSLKRSYLDAEEEKCIVLLRLLHLLEKSDEQCKLILISRERH